MGLELLFKAIPTVHPASVLREWSQRPIVINDLKRAARFKNGEPYPQPKWKFWVRPTYAEAITTLAQLCKRCDEGERIRISFDIETRKGHIACVGIAWSLVEAMCIPLMCIEHKAGYWTEAEEAQIVYLIYKLLTHESVEVVGQNLLYDSQYTWKHWGFVPRVKQDTMIGQHAIFSDMKKGLAFIASMYCDFYVYWKDDGKFWNPTGGADEEKLWKYNCMDCVYTAEVAEAEVQIAAQMGLQKVFEAQHEMFWPVLRAMQLGVRIDQKRRGALIFEVQHEIERRNDFLYQCIGHPLNYNSPPQMKRLFYDDLKLPVQKTRATKGKEAKATLDDNALQKLAQLEPLCKPLVNAIADCRTLGKFLSNFLTRPLSEDGRMRCSFNIGGSESGESAPRTYRLSSSEDAFGCGTNLQTIPSEKSKSIVKAAARGITAGLGDPYSFPNIRNIFIPDPGYTMFDMDLERADLFVVCWEANDEQLKDAMRLGIDVHLYNAYIIRGEECPPLEELVEHHPRYWSHRGPLEGDRQFAKVFVHGTNYGGRPRTIASETGRTVKDIERSQSLWFRAHPGIERWHLRIANQVRTRHFVENRFGYRWYILDRADSVFGESLAWIPQSTVSLVINRIWLNIYKNLPEVQVLLQCHDSLVGQFPTEHKERLSKAIKEQTKVIVPYDDPLTIPVSVHFSEKSWGDCQ